MIKRRAYIKRSPIAAKGPKPRKRASGSRRKQLVKALDTLASLYVRTRDKRANNGLCVFNCGKPIECAFHVITRGRFPVRWDVERNIFGSCSACNFRMTFNQGPFIVWYLARFGQEAYERLVTDSNEVAKWELSELEDLKAELEKKMETVCLSPLGFKPESQTSDATSTNVGPLP